MDRFTLDRKILSLFLIALGLIMSPAIVGAAESKKREAVKKESVSYNRIKGFRSARFGMTEKQVRKAISKDFGKLAKTIKKKVHPTDKTVGIPVNANNLVSDEGTSRISYILGYKTKKLIQINIGLGFPYEKSKSIASVVSAGNLIRGHFLKKNYPKEGMVVNARINEQTVLVFRAIDEKNAGIVLTLQTSEIPPKDDKKKAKTVARLQLYYIKDVKEADIFKLKESAF